MTYAELDRKLQGRCERSRKLANNTWAERDFVTPDQLSIRLHHTRILTFYPDGDIELNTGGWWTVTTKERINRYLQPNYSVHSHSRIWMLHGWGLGGWEPLSLLTDHMVISPRGDIAGAKPFAQWQEELKQEHRENRREAAARRMRCWQWMGNRYCDYWLDSNMKCSRHGQLTLPGHDKED